MERTIIKLGSAGPEVDLALALPLTIGDLESLETNGVVLAKDKLAVSDIVHLLWHVIKKAGPAITLDQVRQIPAGEMGQIVEVIMKNSGLSANNPTSSTSSSSSPASSGGPETKH